MSVVRQQLDRIAAAPADGTGLDVVIVSTTTVAQERAWQRRLEAGRGHVCRADALVLAVTEEWPGGAGNGLGTLEALRAAASKAHRLHHRDLLAELDAGASVGVYHTAGKGTRLAPLPGSEGNDKPAVKLPGTVPIDGRPEPLTILEAVIRQTAVYAPGRRGRVGVWWGDQVFIPSTAPADESARPAAILARLAPMPDADAWRARGLERYGLIAVGADGAATQVEKVDHATASRLIDQGVIAVDGGLGVSLGSFSLSAALARALLEEFAPELAARRGKLDTDPHWWMPLTLDAAAYRAAMTAKGMPAAEADAHHARMAAFAVRFRAASGHQGGLLGCTDVGDAGWWWDYGTVDGYLANVRKLTAATPEASDLRRFFGVEAPVRGGRVGPSVELSCGSVLIDCEIAAGRVEGSVLVGVRAGWVDVKDAVAVNVVAPALLAEDALAYNAAASEPLELAAGTVRVDAVLPGRGRVPLTTRTDRDGKDDWDVRLPGNALSWSELHAANAAARPEDA